MPGHARNRFDPPALPPCSMSRYYLSYLDQLDSPYFLHHEELLVTQDYDAGMVERLRVHLNTCPTCTAMVGHLRRMRSQQQAILHTVLLENEQQVPSSFTAIMEAVRREEPMFPLGNRNQSDITLQVTRATTDSGQVRRKARQAASASLSPANAHQFPLNLRTIFSVTVILVLIIGAALISEQLIMLRSQSKSSASQSSSNQSSAGQSSAANSLSYTSDWDAVIVGQTVHGQMSIENYNPFHRSHTSLIRPLTADAVKIDGISHDGHDVLYQYSSGNHTYYATLHPLPAQGYFYALENQNAGEAIWTSDNRHVLIVEQNEGIVKVDSQTGTAQKVAQIAHVGHLWFYRDGYLYFNYMQTSQLSGLWRVNIVTGMVDLVIKTTNGRSYFLSPDGTTVFYVDTTNALKAKETALFRVNVHALGTSPQILLQIRAIPVGFAADNTLELVQEVHSSFQLVKLKQTQASIERIVMSDVAPDAIALCDHIDMSNAPICDENIVLAPYSTGMLVVGLDKDGSRQIWTDDLVTGTRLPLVTLSSNDTEHVQLPGWDRIRVV